MPAVPRLDFNASPRHTLGVEWEIALKRVYSRPEATVVEVEAAGTAGSGVPALPLADAEKEVSHGA